MKYFTKQYIKECDCKEIQGLKYPLMEYDAVYEKPCGGIYRVRFHIIEKGHNNFNQFGFTVSPTYSDRNNYIWLPTGDQLDEEIIKICKKIKYDYNIGTAKKPDYGWWAQINEREPIDEDEDIVIVKVNRNPLIAKIKLLKELINDGK